MINKRYILFIIMLMFFILFTLTKQTDATITINSSKKQYYYVSVDIISEKKIEKCYIYRKGLSERFSLLLIQNGNKQEKLQTKIMYSRLSNKEATEFKVLLIYSDYTVESKIFKIDKITEERLPIESTTIPRKSNIPITSPSRSGMTTVKPSSSSGKASTSSNRPTQTPKNNSGVNNKKEVVLSKPANNNAYMCNLEIRNDLDIADPYILKANGYYYIYSTGYNGIKLSRTADFKTINGLHRVNKNNKSRFTAYWAPEVYYYKNKYYLFYTGKNDKKGSKIMVATAKSPEGPFTNDYDIKSKVTNPMDATVLFDNNHIYMYTMSMNNKCIYVEELNSSLTKPISSAKKVLNFESKTDNKSDRRKYWDWKQNEGPCVIKSNSKYYLMYSSGTYKDHTYTIGYATSSSPTGVFTKKTLGSNSSSGTSSLLHGSFPVNSKYNSDTNIYGTGHNSVIKISDDELYIVYHSITFKKNKFDTRKIQIDRLGVKNGILFVNGPTTEKQPLISGTNGYYQLKSSKYDVLVGNNKIATLKDNINYNAENSSKNQNKKGLITASKTMTNKVTVSINENCKISDIWLMATEKGWNGVSVDAKINDKYLIKNVKFGNNGTGKFQMPNISERINKVEFTFNKKINLREVSVYYKK